MFTFIQKGGWLMVPIGLCLFGTLAISIERFVNLRMGRFIDLSLLDRIRGYLSKGAFESALHVCRSHNILFHRLLETAIDLRNLPQVDLRQVLMDQSRQEASLLERFLTTLRTIATISPLLGLLGTVAGMIKVFQTLSLVGMSKIADLSGGISEALITTAAGMMVAIPTIVLHNYFDRRVSKILLRVEKPLVECTLLMRSHDAVSKENPA